MLSFYLADYFKRGLSSNYRSDEWLRGDHCRSEVFHLPHEHAGGNEKTPMRPPVDGDVAEIVCNRGEILTRDE